MLNLTGIYIRARYSNSHLGRIRSYWQRFSSIFTNEYWGRWPSCCSSAACMLRCYICLSHSQHTLINWILSSFGFPVVLSKGHWLPLESRRRSKLKSTSYLGQYFKLRPQRHQNLSIQTRTPQEFAGIAIQYLPFAYLDLLHLTMAPLKKQPMIVSLPVSCQTFTPM